MVALDPLGRSSLLCATVATSSSQGCSTLLDGLTESALQHRVREVKWLLRNGIRESGNL
jgi:hypothetical protein